MPEQGMPYRLCMYGDGGRDLSAEPFAETDVTEVRAYEGAHGDLMLAAMERTPRGRWKITTSERYEVPVSLHDRRFATPLDALHRLAKRSGEPLREAVCRCGTGGECD